jgi:hypothetical protein
LALLALWRPVLAGCNSGASVLGHGLSGLVMVMVASRQRAGAAFSLACCWDPLPFCGDGGDAARLGFGLLDMDVIPASERCELQRAAKPPTVDRFEWPQRRQRISLGRENPACLPAAALSGDPHSLLERASRGVERASQDREGARNFEEGASIAITQQQTVRQSRKQTTQQKAGQIVLSIPQTVPSAVHHPPSMDPWPPWPPMRSELRRPGACFIRFSPIVHAPHRQSRTRAWIGFIHLLPLMLVPILARCRHSAWFGAEANNLRARPPRLGSR